MSDVIAQFLTYAFAVWRRRGIAISIAWIVAIAGWAVVSLMPDSYRSQAIIHVNTAIATIHLIALGPKIVR